MHTVLHPTPVSSLHQRFACPMCHTVIAALSAECPLCGHDLQWVSGLPEVAAALRNLTVCRRSQLHVRWSWPGGSAETQGDEQGVSQFTIPGSQQPWTLAVEAGGEQLSLQSNSRSYTFRLPLVKEQVENLELTVRTIVAPQVLTHSAPITEFRPDEIRLSSGRITIGSGIYQDPDFVSLSAPTVSLRHAVILKNQQELWIFDLGTNAGTFVNRVPIAATRLLAGDLIQIGPYAWVFNDVDGMLVPVASIQGAVLELDQVGVRGGSGPLDLLIQPGELVAVVGPSGAGKSTLLRAILGNPADRLSGTVRVQGIDAEANWDAFRRQLGYVSQQDVIHTDLNAVQAVEISAALRGRRATSADVARLLRRLDLPKQRWGAVLSRLSGGELKRVRIAAELVNRPPILLLDEPASGLDDRREKELMRLLRGLSYQGCTVVIVTHNLAHLSLVDRVLALRDQRIVFDGPPEAYEQRKYRTGVNVIASAADPPAAQLRESLKSRPRLKRKTGFFSWLAEAIRQTGILVKRECLRVQNAPINRLGVAIGVLPLVFALSLSLAVPAHDGPLFTFLAVLSAIWMGASLSLLSIVDETEIVDHERRLFLLFPSYIASKCVCLWTISLVQTAVFTLWLWLFCFPLKEDFAVFGLLTLGLLVLALVGWAAVGMGLAVSAVAKWAHRREMAGFLLPLLMMAQIVFSVHIAGDGQTDLPAAYGAFHLHACQGAKGCERRVMYWEPEHGGSLCENCHALWPRGERECRRIFHRSAATAAADKPASEHAVDNDAGSPKPQVSDGMKNESLDLLDKEIRDWLTRKVPESKPTSAKSASAEYLTTNQPANPPPSVAATAASYLTISRYGDILFRVFAHLEPDYRAFTGQLGDDTERMETITGRRRQYGYGRWWWSGICSLLGLAIGLPLLALTTLLVAENWGRLFVLAVGNVQLSHLATYLHWPKRKA